MVKENRMTKTKKNKQTPQARLEWLKKYYARRLSELEEITDQIEKQEKLCQQSQQ